MDALDGLLDELAELRAAGRGLVYVVTFEEDRLEAALRARAARDGFSLAVQWRDEGEATARLAAADRPEVVLFLGWGARDFDGDRALALRRTADALGREGRLALFAGTEPPSAARGAGALERETAVLDLPLPSMDELAAVAAEVPGLPASLVPVLVTTARGLTVREARRAFRRAAIRPDDAAAVMVAEKRRLLGRGGYLEDGGVPEGLDAVGGLDELKRWLLQRKAAFGADARAFGVPLPRGVLLLGVQGCGKSLMAKAVAALWRFPLLRFDLGALFAGDAAPESAVRRVIRTAEATAPCVLWIDEIEKGFAGLKGDASLARVLGTLLVWLQEKREPVFVAATANSIEALPPELLRKGRFDEIFFVDLPDDAERAAIFAVHLLRRGRDAAEFDTSLLVEASRNFTGAEIEQVVVGGLTRAFHAGRALETRDLEAECRRLVPLALTYEEHIKTLRDWASTRARRAGTDVRLAAWFARGRPD